MSHIEEVRRLERVVCQYVWDEMRDPFMCALLLLEVLDTDEEIKGQRARIADQAHDPSRPP